MNIIIVCSSYIATLLTGVCVCICHNWETFIFCTQDLSGHDFVFLVGIGRLLSYWYVLFCYI